MGRATKGVVLGALVVIAGAGGIAYAASRSPQAPAAEDADAPELATAQVTTRDLITYDETTATLVFTTSVTVSSPVAGTVSDVVDVGATLAAGTVVATVDGEPVVAMVGDVPGFRDLSERSSDGADVRQLEQNLVQLGFDPDGEITIDEEFDSATADAVERWEESLGFGDDADGEVPQRQVVFIPGQLLVDDVSAAVGGGVDQGTALLTARQVERQFLISAVLGDGGGVSRLAPEGSAVDTGTVLFWQNYFPVVAIEGDPAALASLERDLYAGVADGADVRLLEQMLVDTGFAAPATLTVDDHFDDATTTAVAAWQASLGMAPGAYGTVVPAGGFVVVPSGLSVGRTLAPSDGVLTSQAPVLVLTEAAREVVASAPIGDETFALGATIDVEFADGTIAQGTIVEVGNVATNANGVPGETPSVDITIQVEDIPRSVESFVQIPVTLRVVDESVQDAFVVPVSALVALAEGGYALEVVDGAAPDGSAASHLVRVTTGLFADGFVEITGEALVDGMTVVVPS